MVPIAPYLGDLLQAGVAAISVILMVISANAYRRRREGRYLLLMLAFVLLCVASVSTLVLESAVGIGPLTVQALEVYVIPAVELLMAASFLAALAWTSGIGRRRLLVVAAAVALVLLGSALYVSIAGANANAQAPLPPGCVKPAGGYLIVATSDGYNDSIGHGAPMKSWPVLDVAAGSNVTITVCNAYEQPVGFQISHYLQNRTESIVPGGVMTVSFVADRTGTFLIYCAIFCPIHLFLQGGEVRVA